MDRLPSGEVVWAKDLRYPLYDVALYVMTTGEMLLINSPISRTHDAQEQERLVELPCAVGSTVYKIVDRCKPRFGECQYSGGHGTGRCGKMPCKEHIASVEFLLSDVNHIGKFIFLTRQQAEAALEGMNATPHA